MTPLKSQFANKGTLNIFSNSLESETLYANHPESVQMEKIVSDYTVIKKIDPKNCKFTGNSVGYKDIVSHLFDDHSMPRSILDIGFGVGDLGRIIKSNPTTQHWSVDGMKGSMTLTATLSYLIKNNTEISGTA